MSAFAILASAGQDGMLEYWNDGMLENSVQMQWPDREGGLSYWEWSMANG